MFDRPVALLDAGVPPDRQLRAIERQPVGVGDVLPVGNPLFAEMEKRDDIMAARSNRSCARTAAMKVSGSRPSGSGAPPGRCRDRRRLHNCRCRGCRAPPSPSAAAARCPATAMRRMCDDHVVIEFAGPLLVLRILDRCGWQPRCQGLRACAGRKWQAFPGPGPASGSQIRAACPIVDHLPVLDRIAGLSEQAHHLPENLAVTARRIRAPASHRCRFRISGGRRLAASPRMASSAASALTP